MPRWAEAARAWVSRLVGRGPTEGEGALAGDPIAIDGISAVLAVEALLGSATSSPGGAREALAQAAGRALGGMRATAHLDGADLLAAHDRLAWASGRGLPLVVHATLGAADGHARATGSGHEGWHGVAGAGCFQLLARSAQEAADLALVARMAAEAALVPGIVGMDREQTATSIQVVRLPPRALLDELAGAEDDAVEPSTDAQRELFGRSRRRVPAWFDLARPVLLGGTQGPEAFGLGAAARRPLVLDPVSGALDRAYAAVSLRTGRPVGAVATHRVDGAELVIVAQGSLTETAEAVADHLASRRVRVGVASLVALRPFPLAELRKALAGARQVVVLERVDVPLAADGPLAAEVRQALAPGARLISAACGLGGLPVRAADLALLCTALPARDRVYVGLDFTPATSRYPRRRATLDALRRDRPDLVGLGIRSPGDAPLDVRPAGACTVEIVRPADVDGPVAAVAEWIEGTGVDGLRARPAERWLDDAVPRIDRVTFGPAGLRDPGDAVPADVVVLVPPMAEPGPAPVARLVAGGAVLVVAPGSPVDALAALPPALLAHLAGAGAEVWTVAPACHVDEAVAGGLAALLLHRGVVSGSERALASARSGALPEGDPEDRLAAFEAAFTSAQAVRLPAAAAAAPAPDHRPPLAVRHLGDGTGALDDVPGFWGQVGILYARGDTDELTPDALLAAGAVPPLTATFRDLTPTRAVFPALDPALCTGCAKCWAACPDGSIGAVAIAPRALLDAGMEAAGGAAAGLRPIAGKIATRLERDAASGMAGEQLSAAIDAACGSLSAERRAAAETGRDAVVAALASLPIVRSAPLFDAAPKGKAELLALVFDPETCKACRTCWAVCPTGAITPAPQDLERVAAAKAGWRAWELLPDTSGATIARVAERDDVDPVGALLLSRHALLAMAGADAAEPGSGDRLALRAVLGVAEARLQPQLQRLVGEATELADQMREAVRATLAQAVPTDDLEALAGGLAGLGPHEVDVGVVLERAAAVRGRTAALDAAAAARLAELLDTARELEALVHRLRTGTIGLGRARLGLVLGPGPAAWWGALYPYNPFQVPVVDDGGPEAAALARGLLDAQLGAAIADLDLLRRARALVAGRGGADPARSFGDLTDSERLAVPPIVVVGDDRLLAGGGLDALLATGLPVRVVVLSDADLLGPVSVEPGLLATARARGVFLLQSSLGAPEHLARGLTDALAFPGAAVVRLHAPSPRRHGFATHRTLDQARLALVTRMWPVLRLDPRGEGVFGSLIDLSGNPSLDTLQVTDGDRALAPLDFASSEARFASASSAARVAASDARLSSFAVLRELAGVCTPFTAAVEAHAEARVAGEREAELAAARTEHAAALAGAHADAQAELAQRVRDRLLQLAGYTPPGEG